MEGLTWYAAVLTLFWDRNRYAELDVKVVRQIWQSGCILADIGPCITEILLHSVSEQF